MSYDGPLIDAHHHFWAVGMGKHAWLEPVPGREMVFGDPTPLYRDYLPPDLRRDAQNWRLAGSVHIEAGWDRGDPVGETRWLEGLATTDGLPTAAVVYAPLDDPAVDEVLALQASFPFVRGVRHILSWHADPNKTFVDDPNLMNSPAWRAGFALLERHVLSFDLMLFPTQMPDAARLAADFPGTLVIVNHCGSPVDRDEAGMQVWRDGLKLLAAQPNVRIKISDLVAYDHHWTIDSLRSVTMACVDAFGPERCMLGSDFPVAGLHATYDEIFGSFDTILSGLTPHEVRGMFHDNAVRDYRLADLLPAG